MAEEKEHHKKHKHKSNLLKISSEELEALKKALDENKDLKDRYLRLQAEVENFKKRMQKEKEEFLKFSNQEFILRLLPVIDNFDRAYQAAKNHKDAEPFSEGVEMILGQLHKLLEDNGVSKMKTIGEKFNPNLHEAIAVEERDDLKEDIIVEEISPGYMMNGRLLRPAVVKIASGKKGKQ